MIKPNKKCQSFIAKMINNTNIIKYIFQTVIKYNQKNKIRNSNIKMKTKH